MNSNNFKIVMFALCFGLFTLTLYMCGQAYGMKSSVLIQQSIDESQYRFMTKQDCIDRFNKFKKTIKYPKDLGEAFIDLLDCKERVRNTYAEKQDEIGIKITGVQAFECVSGIGCHWHEQSNVGTVYETE